MANYDFKKDINIGEAGEVIVRLDLESLGGVFISDNKDNKNNTLHVLSFFWHSGCIV